jgi:hypothetical protein
MRYDYDKRKRECEINGERKPFHCISFIQELDEAKKLWPWPYFIYIGSGKKYWIDDVTHHMDFDVHFFIQNPKQNESRSGGINKQAERVKYKASR